jgi:hypothetical protein
MFYNESIVFLIRRGSAQLTGNVKETGTSPKPDRVRIS